MSEISLFDMGQNKVLASFLHTRNLMYGKKQLTSGAIMAYGT